MLVLGIDGGLSKVGVALVSTDEPVGRVLVWRSDEISPPKSKLDCAELAKRVALWVASRQDEWRLAALDGIVVESVQRARIQSVGVAIVAAITMWYHVRGLPMPMVVMRSGLCKFKLNAGVAAHYAALKGKANYTRRKNLLLDFVRERFAAIAAPIPAEADRFDPVDALLLAVVGVRELHAKRRDTSTGAAEWIALFCGTSK